MTGAIASLQMYGCRRLSWPHPEWWTVSLSVAAWLLILLPAIITREPMVHNHSTNPAPHSLSAVSIPASTRPLLWLLMIAAMMFPIVLDPVRTTAARSLWRRRHRAIMEFLAGYLAVWMLFGIVASFAELVILSRIQIHSTQAAALAFGVAVIWQFLPAKRRALLNCHRILPIAASGWGAERDCIHFGWMIGTSCVISCWALMFGCMLSGHSIPAMFGATAVGWIERNRARPNQRFLCSVIALIAVVHVMVP